ncbi:uncharacterized protein TrAtP1_010293 [Trichoderma atroviride]|uniref:uncharacterized protein n=1 Tax=Hypocrea atroviridis TaxID=63577 RepID=UPI0033233387|nr:hypothetical protein TrAtP1_010293 [Trichoderma atroviride]
MAPIRVGIIGLGAKEAGLLSVGSWAASALLPSFLNSPHYEVVAVSNSSVASSQRSIDFHKLGPNVKAYGSPEDIANDPNVDLVAVSINVGHHYVVTKPALLAKKQVFVEWPLGANTVEAEELTKLARDANLKTIIGTQFISDPALVKLKELVASGAIGKVTSSEAQLAPTFGPPDVWGADATYYLDLKTGGNEFHIALAHCKCNPTRTFAIWATTEANGDTQNSPCRLCGCVGRLCYRQGVVCHTISHSQASRPQHWQDCQPVISQKGPGPHVRPRRPQQRCPRQRQLSPDDGHCWQDHALDHHRYRGRDRVHH